MTTISETEDSLKRIQNHAGVQGVIVVNAEGIPMRTTMDNSTTVMVAAAMNKLTAQASSVVREIDPSDNLTYLRIRSRKKEILMAPENDHLMIVTQQSN